MGIGLIVSRVLREGKGGEGESAVRMEWSSF